MFRIFHIIYILGKYGSILVLSKYGFKKIDKPKLFRRFFEEASGTFIKFGQMLAMRVDMISREYSVELLGLLDNVKPFSYKQVEGIFQNELGSAPDKTFLYFEKEPFASASFGQVHGAKLKDGTVVVVKVQRPGIEAKAKMDFIIVSFLAFIADLFFKIEALPWKEFAKEFKAWTKQEFDYRIEAENGERLYNNNIDNPNIVIPKIFHHLTTRKILVEEYIEGVHLSKILKRLRDGTLDEKKLKVMGIDLRKACRILVFELLRQFVIYGFYHADPHPGNIILLKNDKIGLIDFGITGGKEVMPNKNDFIRWMKATGDMDFEEASYHAANFAGDDLKIMIRSALPATVEPKEIDVFIRKLSDYFVYTTKHLVSENFEKLKSRKKDYNTVLLQVIKAGKKMKVKVPNEFIVFSRGLAILGMLAKQMDTNFYVTDEMKKFFKVYPIEKLFQNEISPAIRRINREAALERVANWLAYLFEADPTLYNLVKNHLSQYGIIN